MEWWHSTPFYFSAYPFRRDIPNRSTPYQQLQPVTPTPPPRLLRFYSANHATRVPPPTYLFPWPLWSSSPNGGMDIVTSWISNIAPHRSSSERFFTFTINFAVKWS
ncbi:hypothetical protein AVEN_73938-1 [Araneus ventricosus]|uniref:Uncharacterized protein n=1 Tax=Araneus ventricosus TaxID=182803 RepID=A0A4Y2JQT2_ARAVE|nr:hypothetical protein AVEN_73938-1 [Araneus ventricosus]